MDYSEALIAIQTAKDKASQVCREKKWEEAIELLNEIEGWALDLKSWIRAKVES